MTRILAYSLILAVSAVLVVTVGTNSAHFVAGLFDQLNVAFDNAAHLSR